jgi:hypothetical protein
LTQNKTDAFGMLVSQAGSRFIPQRMTVEPRWVSGGDGEGWQVFAPSAAQFEGQVFRYPFEQ